MATLINKKFDDLAKTGNNDYSLSEDVMSKIQTMCAEIGYADDRQNTYINQYNAMPPRTADADGSFKPRPKKKTDAEWKTKSGFSVTKFAALDNSQILINEMRSEINKITEKNVDSKIENILKNLEEIVDSTDGDADDLKEKMDKLFAVIFNASITNKLPETYSRVFGAIAQTQLTLANEFIELKMEEYINSMTGIVDVSEQNYDEFCEFTKTNAARKNTSSLICEISKRGTIAALPFERIETLFESLLMKVVNNMNDKSKQKEVDEITENIVVIFKNLGKLMDARKYMDRFKTIATYKNGDKPGLTSRAKFKYADLVGM